MEDYIYEEKKDHSGRQVKILTSTFEKGKPDTMVDWRAKLTTREDVVGYLKTALRYWYSPEGYGSEKRKKEG